MIVTCGPCLFSALCCVYTCVCWQVYACFAALGVAGSKDSSCVSPDGLQALQQLPPPDAASLVVIQQYKAFRQGEVWRDIRADFDGAGLQLTQEDR